MQAVHYADPNAWLQTFIFSLWTASWTFQGCIATILRGRTSSVLLYSQPVSTLNFSTPVFANICKNKFKNWGRIAICQSKNISSSANRGMSRAESSSSSMCGCLLYECWALNLHGLTASVIEAPSIFHIDPVSAALVQLLHYSNCSPCFRSPEVGHDGILSSSL